MKKPTNEKQIEFFDRLIDNKGNVAQAAETVGYERSYAHVLARKYKEYLLERVESVLALEGIRAANVVVNAMHEDGTVPNANIRLAAAQQVLDRIGVSKQERMSVDVSAGQGIFVLPKKDVDIGDS
jgi:hypothetical protein